MRWPDISAQTTPPNVLKLNDFSNLPAGRTSLPNLKKSGRSEWNSPLVPQPYPHGPAPDDE